MRTGVHNKSSLRHAKAAEEAFLTAKRCYKPDIIPAFQCTTNSGDVDVKGDTKNESEFVLPTSSLGIVNAKDVIRPWGSSSKHLQKSFVTFNKMLIRQYSMQCLHKAMSVSCEQDRGEELKEGKSEGNAVDIELLLSLANNVLQQNSRTNSSANLSSTKRKSKETLDKLSRKMCELLDSDLSSCSCGNESLLEKVVQYSTDVLKDKPNTPVTNKIVDSDSSISSSQPFTDAVVVQSEHPHQAKHSQTWVVNVPDAEWLCVAFDSQSRTRLPYIHSTTKMESKDKDSGEDSTSEKAENSNDNKLPYLKNRDGVTVTIGSNDYKIEGGNADGDYSRNVYYCGRYMDQCRCGGCDGHCGPTNGCPCDACDHYYAINKAGQVNKPDEDKPKQKESKDDDECAIADFTEKADAKYDSLNCGAYVTVETGKCDAASETSVRFCGMQWPMSLGAFIDNNSNYDGSIDAKKAKTKQQLRQEIVSGAFLRIPGDTLTVTFTSNDNRPSLWGFKCSVYGMKTRVSTAVPAGVVSPIGELTQKVGSIHSDRRLACWVINALLKEGMNSSSNVASNESTQSHLADKLFTPSLVLGLRNILLSSFNSTSAPTNGDSNSDSKGRSDKKTQVIDNDEPMEYFQKQKMKASQGEEDMQVFSSCVETLNATLHLLPAMHRKVNNTSNKKEFLSEIMILRNKLLSCVSRRRLIEHNSILKSFNQNNKSSWAKENVGIAVWAASNGSGKSCPRWAEGKLVREVVPGELCEIEFEDASIPDVRDAPLNTTTSTTSTAASTDSTGADVKESLEQGNDTSASASTEGGDPRYDIESKYIDEHSNSESGVSTVRMTGARREFVRWDDIKTMPGKLPLPEYPDIDGGLIPYCVNQENREPNNREFAIVRFTYQPNFYRDTNLSSLSSTTPFTYSAKLQEMVEVLTLVDQSIQNSPIEAEKEAKEEKEQKDEKDEKEEKEETNASRAVTGIKANAVSPNWLQVISNATTLLKALRTNAIPEAILMKVYMPLVSSVMSEYQSFPIVPATDDTKTCKQFSFPGANGVLVIFNRAQMNIAVKPSQQRNSEVDITLVTVSNTEKENGNAVVVDSPSLCTERHLLLQRFLARNCSRKMRPRDKNGNVSWRCPAEESGVSFSTVEINDESFKIDLSAPHPITTALECVIIPAYSLEAALALARDKRAFDQQGELQVVKGNILHKHMHNLDALFGSNLSHRGNMHDHVREGDIALTAHVNNRMEKDKKCSPKWEKMKPTEEELNRSVELKHLSDVSVDNTNICGYGSWDIYHPVLALRELVQTTSFTLAKGAVEQQTKNNESISAQSTPNAEAAKAVDKNKDAADGDNADGSCEEKEEEADEEEDEKEEEEEEEEDEDDGLLPGIDRKYYLCEKGSQVDYTTSNVPEYNGNVVCDICRHTFVDGISKEIPIFHCNCGCQYDLCMICATTTFAKNQSSDPNAAPHLKDSYGDCADAVMDALFPNANVFIPYVDAESDIGSAQDTKEENKEGNKEEEKEEEKEQTKKEGEFEGEKINEDTTPAVTIETTVADAETDARKKKEKKEKKLKTAITMQCNSPISIRYLLLLAMNSCIMDCMAFFNLSKISNAADAEAVCEDDCSLVQLLGKCRSLLLDSSRDNYCKRINELTVHNPGREFELRVSRSLALKHAPTITSANGVSGGGEPDRQGRYAVFSQAFRRMHSMPPRNFRHSRKLYELVLMGEYSQDAGGPYRESFDIYCAELQSAALSLLIMSPNGTHNTGLNRDSWVLNPGATSQTELEMFTFFGKLLGIAIRSKGYLNLNLAPMMWKLIAGDSPTLSDLEGIDFGVVKNVLESFRYIDQGEHALDAETFSMTFFETFTTISTDNRKVNLIHGGDDVDVTFENRNEWCTLVEHYRIHEFDVQIAAVRRGLATIVPLDTFNLYPWERVERMVCGKAEVDIDLLKSCTSYDGCRAGDKHIELFWEVLRGFNTEERQALIKFTWGRSRLPLTKEDFHEKFTLTNFHKEPADMYYPVAHTCFFSLELPRYSSKKIMKEKLLYAIFNCLAIDGDETGPGADAAQMGWEDDT